MELFSFSMPIWIYLLAARGHFGRQADKTQLRFRYGRERERERERKGMALINQFLFAFLSFELLLRMTYELEKKHAIQASSYL